LARPILQRSLDVPDIDEKEVTTMPTRNRSRRGVILPIIALALLASCQSDRSDQSYQSNPTERTDDSMYLPSVDDYAILFIHKFNPADYEQGKQIVVNGFSDAIEASGQTRRTYFLSRADSAEVIAISFFHASASSHEWLNSDVRENVLTQLRPLYREPLELRQYSAALIHDTHLTADSEAAYLPAEGDEFVLFLHEFTEDGYAAGKTQIIDEFPRNIKVSAQKIRSYFLDRPDSFEVAVASFEHPESDVDEWLDGEEHRETIETLSPLNRRPLRVARYVVESVHNAN